MLRPPFHFVPFRRRTFISFPPLRDDCATRAVRTTLRSAARDALRSAPRVCVRQAPTLAQCPNEGETLFFKPKTYGRRSTAWLSTSQEPTREDLMSRQTDRSERRN